MELQNPASRKRKLDERGSGRILSRDERRQLLPVSWERLKALCKDAVKPQHILTGVFLGLFHARGSFAFDEIRLGETVGPEADLGGDHHKLRAELRRLLTADSSNPEVIEQLL